MRILLVLLITVASLTASADCGPSDIPKGKAGQEFLYKAFEVIAIVKVIKVEKEADGTDGSYHSSITLQPLELIKGNISKPHIHHVSTVNRESKTLNIGSRHLFTSDRIGRESKTTATWNSKCNTPFRPLEYAKQDIAEFR